MRTAEMWAVIHAERAALARDLADLPADLWDVPSLCQDWTVREVVAHLTAVATTGMIPWLRSVTAARWDFDEHNRNRMIEQLGRSPAETLARFQAAVPSSTRILGPKPAAIGEVVIHAHDIRRPLGLPSRTSPETAAQLMRWFAANEFSVPSRSRVQGLELLATDADVRVGTGPLVRGPALSLLMAMCGREAFLDDLEGAGLEVLATRR